MRTPATIAIWLVSLACVTIGGVIAFVFVTMATSMDPTDLLKDGGQGWIETAEVCLAALGLAVAAAVGLRLWHSERFRMLALALVAAEVVAVGWACVAVYAEYF